MTAQEFLDWMGSCGFRKAREVEEALGLGRNAAARYVAAAKKGEDVPLPRYTAPAMSAVAQGLKPWDEYRR